MAVLTMESVVDLLKKESERVIARLSIASDIYDKLYRTTHLISLLNKLKNYRRTHSISKEIESIIHGIGDGFVVDKDAHLASSFDDVSTAYRTAIKHYTADEGSPERKAHYTSINRFYRLGEGESEADSEKGKRLKDWQITDRMLMRMFSEFPGISKPIRVYRGVSVGIMNKTNKSGFYSDKGYTSATTSLDMAIQYAGPGGAVFIIDLKQGTKAISLMRYSRKPYEEEILLPRGVMLPIKKVIIDKRTVKKFAEAGVFSMFVSNEEVL